MATFHLLHLSRFISESASGSVDASWSLKSLFVVLRMFSTWLALERSPPTLGHPIVFLMAAAQLRRQVQSDADCGSPLPVVRLVTLIVALCVHSVSECGFQVPKTYQAAAHIWGLPR